MASHLKRERSADGPYKPGPQAGFENRPVKRGRPNDSPEEGEVDDDSSVQGTPGEDDIGGDTDGGRASSSNADGPSAKKKNPVAFPFKLKNREPEGTSDTGERAGWDPRDRDRLQRDDRPLRDWERDREYYPRREGRRDFDDRPHRHRGYDRYVPVEEDDWRTRPDDYRHRTRSPPRHDPALPQQHRHHPRRPSRSRSRSPPPKHRLPVSLTSTLPPPPIHLPSRPLTPSTGPYRSPSHGSQSDAPPSTLHRPTFQPFNMPPRLHPPHPRPEIKIDAPLSPDPPQIRPPPAPLPNHNPKSMGLGAVSANGPLPKNVFDADPDEGEISDSGAQTVREPEFPENDSQPQGKTDSVPAKPPIQPTLPATTKDIPPNQDLEDAIARKIREMEALVDGAPDPDPVLSQPKSGLSATSSRVASKVKRTVEQEQEAYGRTFKGCSKLVVYTKDVKLGEGTFGEVFKATHIPSGKKVALKRILMHNESQGFPITAIREIKLLKKLKHRNVVELWDIVVELATEKEKGSIHMVFPYMDHDLAGLLENDNVNLSPSQIKLYMKQLLEGTAYLHRNHIVHRDIKAANLLISNEGILQIADFGLARPISKEWCEKRGYTNCVVTRWYRPPELLLGARKYDGAVDMWGIGCILGEMFERKPILMGESDMAQLDTIFALCGSPTEDNWPGWSQLEGCQGYVVKPNIPRTIAGRFKKHPRETSDLLIALLMLDPSRRITAEQALDHDYFWTAPLPADPKTMPNWEASKEFDKRRAKELLHHQQQQQLAQGFQNRPNNNIHPNARGHPNPPFNNRPGPPNHGPPGNPNSNIRNNPRPPNPTGLPPPMGHRAPPNRVVPSQASQPLQPLRWSGSTGLAAAGVPPDAGPRNPLPPAPMGLPQPKYGGAEGYNGPLQRGGKHPDRPYASGNPSGGHGRMPPTGGNPPYGRPPHDSRGPPPRDGRGSSSAALPYE